MNISDPFWSHCIKVFIILIAALFAVRYVSSRRTWMAPLLFLVFAGILTAPLFLSIDLWHEVNTFRPFLLAMILGFFLLSPFLEWIEKKRIEEGAKRSFRAHAGEIAATFEALAREKIGALLAIEREDSLALISKKGIPLNGEISKEVLATLFTPYTPTHDGGVIISDGKIAACGCVFPLSHNEKIAKDLGTRHRAAMGLSEKTDALVLVASEESGELSLASYGKLHYNISPSDLEKKIVKELEHTHYKSKILLPILAKRKLKKHANVSLSTKSGGSKILILSGILFLTALFASFFPKDQGAFIAFSSASPWVSFPYLAAQKWGWIYTIPAAAGLLLLISLGHQAKLFFYPESRRAEYASFLYILPLIKKRFSYDELKGLTVSASRLWKNLYELRLVKSRFKSWLIMESKSYRKVEEAQALLDPPKSDTNFGEANT